ncbi:kinase-like protein [Obba rivulosa]|uniref:Kinase-like protein n=1 Tax=Obba rivulosa TaxID=1052685 RepID=A0A8E2DHD2_9APHY|nr:kinase-like protein [Obba rivulosa]
MCSSLDMLRTLCSRNSIVPSSYILPHEQNLQRTGDEPKAQGSFADVWQGSHRGRTVALKVFRDPNSGESNGYERKTKEDFYKEAVVWKRLRHSNITQFYGINTTAFPLCLVCEWMPHGTIAQYLFQEPQAYRLVLMIDIAEGMNYLHENKIVHGSLNSANILINDDCQACLCDFGLATLSYAGKPNMSPQDSDGSGPLRWEAPERIDPKRIGVEKPMLSFQSDVYSFAMVTWEVFTGRIPFHDIRSDIQVVSSIMRGVRPHRPRQATWFGLVDEVWDIMEDSWHDDPDKRPQSHRILARLKDVVDWLDRSVLEPPQQWPLEVYQTRTS